MVWVIGIVLAGIVITIAGYIMDRIDGSTLPWPFYVFLAPFMLIIVAAFLVVEAVEKMLVPFDD